MIIYKFLKPGSIAVEVTKMDEAGARQLGVVIREGAMWIKGTM